MSVVDLSAALESRLKTAWTRTPIKWPNIRFVPPTDTNNNPQPYIAFTLRTGSGAEDITLGSDNPWYRWAGVVIINILVQENSGMGLARFYADLIKKIYLDPPRDFQYQASGIIRLYVPQIIEIGAIAGWAQVNIIVPFKVDSQS